MDEVLPKLWISDISAATDAALLASHNVRAVVSVVRGSVELPAVGLPRLTWPSVLPVRTDLEVPPDRLRLQNIVAHVIPVDDDDLADLLTHLPKAVEAIRAGLLTGGGVLVHCQAGMSASAPLATWTPILRLTDGHVCLLQRSLGDCRRSISYGNLEANARRSRQPDSRCASLHPVRRGYTCFPSRLLGFRPDVSCPSCRPSSTFLAQLEVFAAAGHRVSANDASTRAFYRERMMSDMMGPFPFSSHFFLECRRVYPASDTRDDDAWRWSPPAGRSFGSSTSHLARMPAQSTPSGTPGAPTINRRRKLRCASCR